MLLLLFPGSATRARSMYGGFFCLFVLASFCFLYHWVFQVVSRWQGLLKQVLVWLLGLVYLGVSCVHLLLFHLFNLVALYKLSLLLLGVFLLEDYQHSLVSQLFSVKPLNYAF